MNVPVGRLCLAAIAITFSGLAGERVRGQEIADPYLNFAEFTALRNADDLGFLDYLKWSGMTLVNAPALQNVTAVYGYTDQTISTFVAEGCSERGEIGNFHLKVIGPRPVFGSGASEVQFDDFRKFATTAGELATAISDSKRGGDEIADIWGGSEAQVEDLQKFATMAEQFAAAIGDGEELDFPWALEIELEDLQHFAMTAEHIGKVIRNDSDFSAHQAFDGQPVDVREFKRTAELIAGATGHGEDLGLRWGEVQVSNLCDLRVFVSGDDDEYGVNWGRVGAYLDVAWFSVSEPKLLGIYLDLVPNFADSGIRAAEPIILSGERLPQLSETVQYIAVCNPDIVELGDRKPPSFCRDLYAYHGLVQ